MSDFFGKLKSGAGKVAFEAEKLNRLNRAKGDLEKMKSQIQAQYAKLGETYYSQRATTGVTGPVYEDICQAIETLEHQAVSKNEEIQRINAETFGAPEVQPSSQAASAPAQAPAPSAAPQSAPPTPAVETAAATKFCSNCGKEIPVNVKFCPDCGAKV